MSENDELILPRQYGTSISIRKDEPATVTINQNDDDQNNCVILTGPQCVALVKFLETHGMAY